MIKKTTLLIFLAFCIVGLNAQIIADFESPATTPVFTSEGHYEVVDNPDKSGINTSNKVGYHKKIAGNWHYVTMTFDQKQNFKYNSTLTFKIHTSQKGRIFAKFWNGNNIAIEAWAPEYAFMPEPGEWVECYMDITPAQNTQFDKLELAACVDNETEADVYFDDVVLSNPEMGDGTPKALFTVSATKINVNQSVTFDASAAFDFDGQIVSYNWSFGDGQTATGKIVEHTYNTSGAYAPKLTVTDNEDKSKTDSVFVFVFEPGNFLSNLVFVTPQPETNKKIEAIFQVNKNYNNVFNPDEVAVDAIITKPDGLQYTIPCFYYVKSYMSVTNWLVDSSYQAWMLRLNAPLPGNYSVKIMLTDADGTVYSIPQNFTVVQGTNKGIVHNNPENRQYYKHETGEPYYPLGINIGWNSTANYTKTLNTLSAGKANTFRYWHTPFAQQALEWKTTNFYQGLGRYSQQAAAMTDSLLNLGQVKDMYMQLVMFQHGMVSENVDAMWDDNPYNITNGGFVDRAEKFFYDEQCIKQTKKLIRYIVARWAYSKNLFAWEFFNEVQFSGINNSQTAQWLPGVLSWHSQMSAYVNAIDPYNHITTTSASHEQLLKLDTVKHLDNLQYHLYSDKMLTDQIYYDNHFLNNLNNKSVINGEYGTNVEANVPQDMQRHSIWNGIMTQVPRYMWLWEYYTDASWANMFRMPANYMATENFANTDGLAPITIKAVNSKTELSTTAMGNGNNVYAYIYDPFNAQNITDTYIEIKDLPFGYYDIMYYLPVNGTEYVIADVPLIKLTNKIKLPAFDKGIAIKVKHKSVYMLPVAIAGNDTVVSPNTTINLSGSLSRGMSNMPLSYNWAVALKPDQSQSNIANHTSENITFTPDVSGLYYITLKVEQSGLSSVNDTIQVLVSNVPVAVAGNDTIVGSDTKNVYFDGSKSYDTDGDPLTYFWRVISAPDGSSRSIFNNLGAKVRLKIDAVGVFELELTVSDGISVSQPDTVKVSVNTVGVAQNVKSQIKMFPNPVNDNLTIICDNIIDKLEIYDITGKILSQLNSINLNQTVINCQNLNRAVVIVKVYTNNSVSAYKLVLKQ